MLQKILELLIQPVCSATALDAFLLLAVIPSKESATLRIAIRFLWICDVFATTSKALEPSALLKNTDVFDAYVASFKASGSDANALLVQMNSENESSISVASFIKPVMKALGIEVMRSTLSVHDKSNIDSPTSKGATKLVDKKLHKSIQIHRMTIERAPNDGITGYTMRIL